MNNPLVNNQGIFFEGVGKSESPEVRKSVPLGRGWRMKKSHYLNLQIQEAES